MDALVDSCVAEMNRLKIPKRYFYAWKFISASEITPFLRLEDKE